MQTLRLDVEEHRGNSTLAETKHVRHVVVGRAPALFILPCGDSDCRDGGHDVTDAMMQRLRERSTAFVLEHECGGDIRGVRCDRVLRVHGTAGYAKT